jgi:hypothetical protein
MSPSPPIHASTRPAETLPSSTVLSSSSFTTQLPPGSSQSAQLTGARPAGLRRSLELRASPRLAVATCGTRVSRQSSPCPPFSLSRSLAQLPCEPARAAVGCRHRRCSGDSWQASPPPNGSPRRAESVAPAHAPEFGLNRPIVAAPESSRSR